MNRTADQDRVRDGAVITFLAAVFMAVLAFQICLNTKPGQFLPKQLTLRNDTTGVYIIQGIEDSAAEASLIRESLSGNGSMTAGECWLEITNDNLDPFFLLAVAFPGAARFIIEIGFFLKFGLAAAFMYYFCCRHIGPGRIMSVILGLSYAFASQVILLAQFSAVMNLAVLFPLVLSSYDSFLRKRTIKKFIFATVVSALLAACGTCADIVGLPFLVLASLIMCLALYDTAKTILSSWVRLLTTEIVGLLLAGFIVFPRFASLEPVFDFEAAYEKAAVNYTFFDILIRTKLMQAGGITGEVAPEWYFGILAVTALVLFAANRKIPFRLKAGVFAVTAVTFITCCSSFVREMFTLVKVTPVITGSRLICLSAILIFAAALSIKNASGLANGVYFASCLIPCAMVMLSNVRSYDGKSSAMSLVLTILAYVICACAVRYQAEGGSGWKMKTFAVLAVFTVFCNTAFQIANNTVKAIAVRNPYGASEQEDMARLSCEEGFEMSVFTDSDKIRYLITSTDLSEAAGDMEYVRALNLASQSALTGDLFTFESASAYNMRNMTADGMNRYSISSGHSEASFSVGSDGEGRCFIFSSFTCPGSISFNQGGYNSNMEFDGSYICEVGNDGGIGTVYLSYNSNVEETGEITFQRLIPGALEALNEATHTSDGLKFSFGFDDIPGMQGGIKTVIFSIPYSDDYSVRIAGREAKTFEYNGRLAAVFSCSSDTPSYDVVIGRKVPGLGGGIAVSVVIGIFLIAMAVKGGYNNKASSDDGKAGSDAQQEDN